MTVKMEDRNRDFSEAVLHGKTHFFGLAKLDDMLELQMAGTLSRSFKQCDIAVERVDASQKRLSARNVQTEGTGVGQQIDHFNAPGVDHKIHNLLDSGVVIQPGSPVKKASHALLVSVDASSEIAQERARAGRRKIKFLLQSLSYTRPRHAPSHLSFFIGHSSFEQSVAVCRSQSIYPVVVRLQRKRIPVRPMGVNLKGCPDLVVSRQNPANFLVWRPSRPLPKNPVAF